MGTPIGVRSNKKKAGASKVGGWSMDMLKALGTAYLKHAAKEKLGLDL
jgi:hypothetical protein